MATIKTRVALALLLTCLCSTVVVSQTPFLRLQYKEYAAGTIYERHLAEYDILDSALGEAWRFAEQKEYAKAHEVLAAAITKLYKSPDAPRYIEEQAIDENYLGLLIVADSGLSFAQGRVREAFNKLYAGDALVSYSMLLEPSHRGRTINPGFLDFLPFYSPEDVVRYCFKATRIWLLSGSLEVFNQEWIIAPVGDFQLYFDELWKCKDKEKFEYELRWYLENTRDFAEDLIFLSRDDVPETALYKRVVYEYVFWAKPKSDRYFAINVVLDKDRAYEFIENYYGLH